MANFDDHINALLKAEGGYKLTNIKGDRGKWTYAGISKRFNPDTPLWDCLERGDIDEAKEEVHKIYKAKYWDRIRGDEIENDDVAEQMFSAAVNFGVKPASRMAQVIVGVNVDGNIGPQSVKAINRFDAELFDARYALLRIWHYWQIVKGDKTQLQFLVGWLARVYHEVND